MRAKWRNYGILVSVVGCSLAIFTYCLQVRQPSYQGKPLTAWLSGLPQFDSLPRGGENIVTNESTEALRHIGSSAVPVITRMLEARDAPGVRRCKRWANDLLQDQSLTKFRFSYAEDKRLVALKGVYVLASEARPAIPAIMRLLDEGLEVRPALIALARIGPEAVPALTQALTNQAIRDDAVGFLTHFNEQGDLIVPALMKCLDDPDREWRKRAAFFLASFGQSASQAVPRLQQMAASSDFGERSGAVKTLVVLDAEGTLRLILTNLDSPDFAIRAQYADNLRWFGHQGRPAIPALVSRLEDRTAEVRRAAAIAIGEIGEEPDTVIPALVERLKDDDLWVRTFAGLGLGKFGNRAKVALPEIARLVEEHKTNDYYRIQIQGALERIGAQDIGGKVK